MEYALFMRNVVLRTYGAATPGHHRPMTYQGARSRPAESETKRPFSVSKVRLDDAGWVAHVLWSEVDSKSNLDVGDRVVEWIGDEAMSPVADAVAALKAGDQVFALFASAKGLTPGQQFTFVDDGDGRQTIVLQGAPIDAHKVHDMDRLAGMLVQ